jgi:hypothetical protein
LRVWDLESGKEIASFIGESEIDRFAIAPDEQTIIAGDRSGRVHFLRLVEADPTKGVYVQEKAEQIDLQSSLVISHLRDTSDARTVHHNRRVLQVPVVARHLFHKTIRAINRAI